MAELGQAFERLVDIMNTLRSPNIGCPWDLEQNHKSITPYLLEEAYEVIEAIQDEDDSEFSIELGDLLLQVVFHAQMAKERQAFTINDVVRHISEKLIRRHPHVFADTNVQNSHEVLKNWEQIKIEERANNSPHKQSALSGVPKSMPSLIRAQRLGEKAARVAFDWDDIRGVWAKVTEEYQELGEHIDTVIKNGNAVSNDTLRKDLLHELGDMLFSLCQLSRWLGITSEEALHEACGRFLSRFESMEEINKDSLKNMSTNDLDKLWNKAKARTFRK